MLGFSLPKILVLILVVLVVWYGFKVASRINKGRDNRANIPKEDRETQIPVKDMVKCPDCGAYSASPESHICNG